MNFFWLIESPRSVAIFKSLITRKPRSCCFLFNARRRAVTSCKGEVEPPANAISASQSTSSDHKLLCSYGDINFDLGIYGVLMGKLIKFGQSQSTLSLYQNDVVGFGIDADLSILNSLVVFFCELGNLDYAIRHFDRLISMNFVPTKPACVAILLGLFAEEKFLVAFHYFIKICNVGADLNCQSYNVLVDGLCYKGYLNEVMEVFDIMRNRKGLEPTLRQYKYLFYGLCKRERIVEAESCTREMESQGFSVDKVMYTSLIYGYCRHKKMKMAMRIYFRMLKTGCEPDAYTYNTLIHLFFEMGLFDKGWVLYKQMSDWGLQPNVVTNNIVISNYCRVGEVDAALMLLNSMASSNLAPDVCSYTVLIDALYKHNRLVDVNELYKKMLANGVAPDHILFFILLKRCPKGKELQLALMLLREFAKIGCGIDPMILSKSATLNHTGDLNKEIKEIELLLEEVVKSDPNLANVAFGIYASALCKGGKIEEAFLCFSQFVNFGCKPLACTCHTLIKCLYQEGLCKKAKAIIEFMQDIGMVADMRTYILMVEGNCELGNLDSALDILDQMETRGRKPDVAIYDAIIGCLCKKKKIFEAENMFVRMLEAGVNPDDVVFTTMINGYFQNGKRAEACELFAML